MAVPRGPPTPDPRHLAFPASFSPRPHSRDVAEMLKPPRIQHRAGRDLTSFVIFFPSINTERIIIRRQTTPWKIKQIKKKPGMCSGRNIVGPVEKRTKRRLTASRTKEIIQITSED